MVMICMNFDTSKLAVSAEKYAGFWLAYGKKTLELQTKFAVPALHPYSDVNNMRLARY